MTGYKEQMKEYIAEMRRAGVPTNLQRAWLNGWKAGYWETQRSHEPRPYEGVKDAMIVTHGDFDRMGRKVSTGKAHQFTGLSPKEASPQYRDRNELRYKEADYISVTQYPVTLDTSTIERPKGEPDFSKVTVNHRFDLEVCEFTYGFYSKENRYVLYSPINHNRKGLSPRSRVLILRSIGMSPKKIASVEKLPYDTVKTWLRDLKEYPLLPATAHDWASGVDERGDRRVFSKRSPTDARHIKPQDSGSSDYDNRVDMAPDMPVGYRPTKQSPHKKVAGLTEGEKGLLKNIRGRKHAHQV